MLKSDWTMLTMRLPMPFRDIAARKLCGENARQMLVAFHYFVTRGKWRVLLCPEGGKRGGLIAVLYRRGKTWRTSEPVMYANEARARSGESVDVPRAIASDVDDWESRLPNLVVTEPEPVRTTAGQSVVIRGFRSRVGKHYESVILRSSTRVASNWLMFTMIPG